jgi:hypothetical protein
MGSRKRLPKVGNAQTERVGVGIVTVQAARARDQGGLGFIFRDQPMADAGIDGHIEVIDASTGEYTGKLIGVQVKAGPSYFTRPSGNGWTLRIKRSTVAYWRQYAVPVVVALVDVATTTVYWALGSARELPSTKTSFKIFVPASQRLDANSAEVLAALAQQAPAELIARLRTLSAEMTTALAREVERFREAWREGHRSAVRAWLSSWTSAPERLADVDGPVAGALYRFAARSALDEDADDATVHAWLDEARHRDPSGDDATVRAALSLRDGNAAAALAILEHALDSAAQIARARILCAMGDASGARAVLEAVTPQTAADRADAWHLRAHLAVLNGDWETAFSALAEDAAVPNRYVSVRLLRAKLRYYQGVVPAARPRDLADWPSPVIEELLRTDADGICALESAVVAFRDLLEVEWTRAGRRLLEVWYLAAHMARPGTREHATSFLQDVLARDPAQPFVLHWAVTFGLVPDVGPSLAALAVELNRAFDPQLAVIYIRSRLGSGRVDGTAEWLEACQEQFIERGASDRWRSERARVHLAAGEVAAARAVVAALPSDAGLRMEYEILAVEAQLAGNVAGMTEQWAQMARDTGDVRWLVQGCRQLADVGRWDLVVQHLDLLLAAAPTAFVRRLAIFALYHTRNLPRCLSLLDAALDSEDDGVDHLELRRMRGEVRFQTGQLRGALEDLRVAKTLSGSPAATRDILALARACLHAGQTQELAVCAREAMRHPALDAANALALSEALAHDDRLLAVDLWRVAQGRGISDTQVPSTVALGYRLGLDAEVQPFYARMTALARTGVPYVTAIRLDELLDQQHEWQSQRQEVLDLYRLGESATHMIAQFLNEPLAHFYHALPAASESQPALRHAFALWFRDGGRVVLGPTSTLAEPGRLALDLSALLLAHHLGLLPVVEQQFAPIRLSAVILVALREERDKLSPQQPSRLEMSRQLLRAERENRIRCWTGDLPALDVDTLAAAGHGARWVALLERARRERAFVLDRPLRDTLPHGRPSAVAGAERVARLVTVADLRRCLVALGVLEAQDPPAKRGGGTAIVGGETVHRDAEQLPTQQSRAKPAEGPRAILPTLGETVYVTAAGADALTTAGLLALVAETFDVRVDPSDQAAIRATLDEMGELEERATWVDGLLRRVSDGLEDGRYELLSPIHAKHVSQPSPTHDSHGQVSEAAPRANDGQDAQSHPAVAEDASPSAAPEVRHAAPDDTAAHTEESNAPDDRQSFSLSIRVLEDVVGQPAGTVDAVWIDDRWFNHHEFAGTARIVDVLDVLSTLAKADRITTQRRWALHHQLRRANIRLVPLITDELLHWLRAAQITDGVVVETPQLRVLRHYVAAVFEDMRALRRPTPQRLTEGGTGELEYVKAYNTAIRESLIALWESTWHEPADAEMRLPEAQSTWLMSSLYINVGLLRAHATPSPRDGHSGERDGVAELANATAATDLTMSAADAAALLTNVVQLINAGGRTPQQNEDVARAYAGWVYATLVKDRAERDAPFRTALVAELRAFAMGLAESNSEDPQTEEIGRVAAGWTLDALPVSLHDAVSDDQRLMRRLGRAVVTTLTVGEWQFDVRQIGAGVAQLLATGAPKDGTLTITPLHSASGETLTLARRGPMAFAISSSDDGQELPIHETGFGLLSPDRAERLAACGALRREVDSDVRTWSRVAERLIDDDDPADRYYAFVTLRLRTLGARYATMRERWRETGQVDIDDLHAPPREDVFAHLRLRDDVVSHADIDGGARAGVREASDAGESAIESGATFHSAWERAARLLIDEEGVSVAFERLSSMPVPLPLTVCRGLEDMRPEERVAFVRRILATPTSPVGAVHVLRVLAWFGETSATYRRLARRLLRRAATPEFSAHVRLLVECATEALDALQAGSVDDHRPLIGKALPQSDTLRSVHLADDTGKGASDLQHYALAWYHAHRVVAAMMAARFAPEPMIDWLTSRPARTTGVLFAPSQWRVRDVADPRLLSLSRFVVGALQYVGHGTALFAESNGLLNTLAPSLTTAADIPSLSNLDLARDLESSADVLGTWLRPTRSRHGSIAIAEHEVVPPRFSPNVIRMEALTELERDPFDELPWLQLMLVDGDAPLIGEDRDHFYRAVGSVDLGRLLRRLDGTALLAARRLARQAVAERGREQRERLRDAIAAGAREWAAVSSRVPARVVPDREAHVTSTENIETWQRATIDALYVLAQVESTPAASMRRFCRDLATLGRIDDAYLRAVRPVLEQLVRGRPLSEALACLPLLLEARGG